MRRNALFCLMVLGFVVSTTLSFNPRVCLGFDLGGGDGKKMVKDLFGISTPKKQNSLNGTYKVDKRSYTEARMKIKQVQVTDDETILRFRLVNSTKKKYGMGIYPAGNKGAYFIVSTDGKKKFRLIDSQGINILPGKYMYVPVGKSKEFTISFERIDDSMTRFHLMEGNLKKNAWHFMNINLGKPRPGDDDISTWGQIIDQVLKDAK